MKGSFDPRPGETICSGCSGGKIEVEEEKNRTGKKMRYEKGKEAQIVAEEGT